MKTSNIPWVNALGIFLLLPAFMSAQETLEGHEFLIIALSDYEVNEPLITDEVKFPWIEELELRTQTRDFDFDEQEYTFRVSPSTPAKRKAQEALYKHYRDLPDFKGRQDLCERATSAQSDWISLYLINQNRVVLNQMLEILEDRRRVYEKMLGSLDFDLDKLVKLQARKSDITVAIKELELDRDQILSYYDLGSRVPDFSGFIRVEGISEKLAIDILEPEYLEDPEDLYEKEEIDKEIALEEAESRQYLDFAQIRYRGPHSDLLQERVSIGVGLRIPTSGNRKLRIKELQLEQQDLQRSAERSQEESQKELLESKSDLLKDIKRYNHYISTINAERAQLQELGDRLSREEGFSPLILLEIEERHIDTQLEGLKLQEDVLDEYLEYLSRSGMICADVRINQFQQ